MAVVRDIKNLGVSCVTLPLIFGGFGIIALGAVVFGIGAIIEKKAGLHDPIL
jgi:hypothetical protein